MRRECSKLRLPSCCTALRIFTFRRLAQSGKLRGRWDFRASQNRAQPSNNLARTFASRKETVTLILGKKFLKLRIVESPMRIRKSADSYTTRGSSGLTALRCKAAITCAANMSVDFYAVSELMDDLLTLTRHLASVAGRQIYPAFRRVGTSHCNS